MGYAHGRRWSDEAIKEEIINVMENLNSDRMPTKSEMDLVTGNYALSNKVAKSGGYKYWAKKLGLGLKESETKFGNEWELIIKEQVEQQGYEVEKMTTIHPYDLLINNNIKVDVKVSRYYYKDKYKYHTFNLDKKYHNCDIFICIGLNNQEEIDKTLIIPSKYLMGIKQLSVGVNSKYDKYNNKWDYLEKYSDFYAVTI